GLLAGADVGDLSSFCPADGASPLPPEELRVEGPTVEATFDGCSVSLRVRRAAGEPFLRLEGWVDNSRPDHRLRLVVTLPELTDRAVAGSPFELVERGLASEGGFEPDSPTWPARGVGLAAG